MRGLVAFWIVMMSAAASADVRITSLEAKSEGDRISVSFALEGAFEREVLVREIESGLPAVFTYELQLVRKRSNWFDSVLARSLVEVSSTLNSVTREYLVNYRRDGKLVRSESFRDFEKMAKAMTSIRETGLFNVSDRRLDRLRVRVRCEVSTEVVFYIVPRTVGTDWKTCRIGLAGEGRR